MQLIFAVLITVLGGAWARSEGAPNQACTTMTPSHNNNVAQTTTSGISITPSATMYTCDSTISVTLSGATFKGFLCQARTNAAQYSPTGYIEVGSYKNNCEDGMAITHTEAGDKSSVTFNWKPSGQPENFYFVCTFVRNYTTFYVREMSAMVSYNGQANMQCEKAGSSSQVITQSALFIAVFTAIAKLLF